MLHFKITFWNDTSSSILGDDRLKHTYLEHVSLLGDV